MRAPDHSVVFTGSRAKVLPIAILTPVFLFIFGLPLAAFISVAIDRGVDAKDVAICGGFGAGFFIFLYAEIIFVRLLIRPNSLTVSREGLSITKLGKTTSYIWQQMGEPVKK